MHLLWGCSMTENLTSVFIAFMKRTLMIVCNNYERSFDELLKDNYGTAFQPKFKIYFHDDRPRFYYERSRFS